MERNLEKRFTLEELKSVVSTGPLLISVNGKIYDVSSKPGFYGPGASYGVFPGNDASYCLATMSTDTDCLNRAVRGVLNEQQAQVLAQWEARFDTQYPVKGILPEFYQAS